MSLTINKDDQYTWQDGK